ncbi:hypothetical protein D3C87_840520 [compost metagenome]
MAGSAASISKRLLASSTSRLALDSSASSCLALKCTPWLRLRRHEASISARRTPSGTSPSRCSFSRASRASRCSLGEFVFIGVIKRSGSSTLRLHTSAPWRNLYVNVRAMASALRRLCSVRWTVSSFFASRLAPTGSASPTNLRLNSVTVGASLLAKSSSQTPINQSCHTSAFTKNARALSSRLSR